MSDERELPGRVWIDPGFFGSHGLWEYDRPDDDGDHVPYLRADKPVAWALVTGDGTFLGADNSKRATENSLAWWREHHDPETTLHPVYIGPAIEPEEESDE